jgi:lipopolysaccharide transport system permease protein
MRGRRVKVAHQRHLAHGSHTDFMKEELKELFKYRGLLYMITYRDVKVRYKQSVMGLLWAVLMPVLIVLSGVVVRYGYAMAAHAQLQSADIAGVAVKSLPWAFLVSSIRFSSLSLINNRELVTKIYFPKEIFPIAAMLASFFDLVVASGALVIFLLLLHIIWSPYLAWAPVLLLTLVLLVSGIGMIVAAASLYFRDVKFIVEVVLTFGIFFTPVFYDVGMFGDKKKWLLLNPISPLLDGFGACIARHQSPDLPWCLYSLICALLTLVGGYVFFKHMEPGFAESI